MAVIIKGNKEILNFLAQLPYLYNHRAMQSVNAQAAKILVNREHQLAPVGKTGKLADSIGIIKTQLAKAGSIGEVQVGPRRGKFGGSFAHLVEFGTKERHHKNGKSVGVMPKHPFVEPAFDDTKGEVEKSIQENLANKTYSFMRRLLKSNG